MRPVTDKFRVSRSKLAYLIDSTAAPICIIAPISSWAAAVSGSLNDAGVVLLNMNAFDLFLQLIPYNFYALFTIVMIIAICILGFDFGPIAIGSGTITQEYTVNGEAKSVEMPYTFEAGQLQGECPENGFQYVVEPLEGDGICYPLFVPDEEGNVTCATIFMVRK